MKNKTLKAVISVVLAVIMLSFTLITASAATEFNFSDNVGNWMVGNEYLEFCTNPNGLYTVGTTDGNPSIDTDSNQYLLYHHSSPRTSYATAVVDGTPYPLGLDGNNGVYPSNRFYDETTGSVKSSYTIDNIAVDQILTIVANNSTGRKDVVEFKYVMKNNDTQSHKIGCRIMFDTMLADNDDAPFRVPGTGDVITQTEYEGTDIPQYWQVFDSLINPSVIAQGTFIRAGYTAPDKVQLTNWSSVMGTPWECPVYSGYENGDSAVTVTWYEKDLAAGQSFTFVTYYGLSEFQQVTKQLSLSLYADKSVDVIDGAYAPNPTVVTAYVKNVSGVPVEDVVINLSTAAPLSFTSGSPAVVSIGTLQPGEEKMISWSLDVSLSDETVTVPVTATLTGTDVETLTLTENITIPQLIIEEPEEPDEPDEPDTPDEPVQPKRNFFQKIWDFFVRIFVFLGLS